MDRINRLLMQARRAVNGKGIYILGFVDWDYQKQKYTASGTITNGVAGSWSESFYSEHDTPEEALSACEEIASKYPDSNNVNFIMDDLNFPDLLGSG